MIFSQWQPQGGFKYFESDQVHPIGDDLPNVRMPAASGGIGVPAQDVGYALPAGAKFVGEGKQPRGIMVPMSREGGSTLSGLGQLSKAKLSQDDVVMVLALIGILGAAAFAGRSGK